MNEERIKGFVPVIESAKRRHGVHRWQLCTGDSVVALSAQNWEDFEQQLKQTKKEDQVVASPELMTSAGNSTEETVKMRAVIDNRIKQVLEFSKNCQETLFLLGTAVFQENDKPTNSVLFIKDGRKLGQVDKRHAATKAETEAFDMPANNPAVLVPGTNIGILICADFAKAFMRSKPNQIHPEAKALIVPSCWGWGASEIGIKTFGANGWYHRNLTISAQMLLRSFDEVGEILIIDRVPVVKDDSEWLVPTAPFNVLLKR